MFLGLVPAMARRTPRGFFFFSHCNLAELANLYRSTAKKRLSERAKFENDI